LLAKGIDLNGVLCDIGIAKDAIYQYASNALIEIAFSMAQKNYQWQFEYQEPSATFMRLNNPPESLDDIDLFGNHFQYLSAARLAPQKSYLKDTYQVEVLRQISYQKGLGEFRGVNAFEIRYQFSSTHEFKAENVGFCISYVLPLIVVILSAKPDSLILIENPEAHLHPKGQSKLAELIALAAQNGVQILVETHSDHIVNGTLVAVRKSETHQGIDPEKVKIHYFLQSDSTTSVINLPVLEGGKIKNPPAGFF